MTLRVDWSRADDVPAEPANQFVVNVGLPDKAGTPDGVYLLLGHLTPPILLPGTRNEVVEQLETIQSKRTVEVRGRYLLSRQRLNELIEVLQIAAVQYDKIAERGKEPDD